MNKKAMSQVEARAALDSTAAARAQIAALGMCPPWRHAAFGGIMGLLVGGIGFELPVQLTCTGLALVGIAAIASYDRRRYGVFINGYRKGATRPFTFALLAVMIGLMLVQIWLRERDAPGQLHFAIGLATALIGTGASVIWSRIFRREMERAA